MQPSLNPFSQRRLTSQKPTVVKPVDDGQSSVRASGIRGQSGEERAAVLNRIAQDPTARATRIHYLNTLGQKLYNELEGTEQITTSRLAWMQRQLNKQDI